MSKDMVVNGFQVFQGKLDEKYQELHPWQVEAFGIALAECWRILEAKHPDRRKK